MSLLDAKGFEPLSVHGAANTPAAATELWPVDHVGFLEIPGAVSRVVLAAAGGTVYYTLDGTDPSAADGAQVGFPIASGGKDLIDLNDKVTLKVIGSGSGRIQYQFGR